MTIVFNMEKDIIMYICVAAKMTHAASKRKIINAPRTKLSCRNFVYIGYRVFDDRGREANRIWIQQTGASRGGKLYLSRARAYA